MPGNSMVSISSRSCLEKNRYTIWADHDALKCILNITDSAGPLTRWRLRFSKFDPAVGHRAGIRHQAADTLLQVSTSDKDESPLEGDFLLYAMDNSDNPLVAVHTVAQDEDRARREQSTSPS